MPDNISNTQFSSELKSEAIERIEPSVEIKETAAKKVEQVLNLPKNKQNVTIPDGKIEERSVLGSENESTTTKLSEESKNDVVKAGRNEDLEEFAKDDSNYPKMEAVM